ncbi:hypothetical protein HOY80DRAFT_1081693 [Tuber brumale]|nr:hypothetical protein HOY80DRAFT_1081693 [Tuber brumale]
MPCRPDPPFPGHSGTLRIMEKQIEGLGKEVKFLCPLKDTAVDIRTRFLATFCRSRQLGGISNPSAIQLGNQRAHYSDIMTDVTLFEDGLISYAETFRTLNGVDWPTASDLIGTALLLHGHMVSAMNRRATMIAKEQENWIKEAEFMELVQWTLRASKEELARYTANMAGATLEKRLFLRLF